MSGSRIIYNPERSVWNAFLDDLASGNLQQSFEYGEAAKMSNPHVKVARFLATEGTSSAGLVQATYRRARVLGVGDTLEVGGVYGYGPVVADAKDQQKVLNELMLALEEFLIRNRITQAFIHRPESCHLLEDMGYNLVSVFNIYKVDLRKSVDELWRTMAHNKRRNINKAQAAGVEVFQSTNCDDFDFFYEMLAISGRRAGFDPPAFSLLDACLKVFGESGKARVFLAKLRGQCVAGVFVVAHSDTAYALGAGSREEDWSVRPNDILHWKAMEWACREGFSHYHMGYVSEPPPTEDSPAWGLWRWKREWKGQLEKIFLYHKVYMPKLRKFVLGPYGKIYNAFSKARAGHVI